MQVKIEKLVFGGQALGRIENKIAFIWGALPGEEVEFKAIRKKSNFIEGVVTKILTASPHRIEPKDDHYLSCSPWQALTYGMENEWKKTIAEETYRKIGGFKDLDLELVASDEQYEYRNKIEYNFAEKNGNLYLAFHDRGTHNLRALEKCVLADKLIQKASADLIEELRKGSVPLSALKSLIVRSDSKGAAAALFVTDKDYLNKFYVPNVSELKGFEVYYSNPLSPASVPTQLLFSTGDAELEEVINDVRLKFGLLSFFQINPPIFQKALNDISKFVSGERVIDYYSGVGAISLPLHDKYKNAVLVEENAEAVDFAIKNLAINNFTNIEVQNILAEDSKIEITKKDVVILDPPRTGIHKRMLSHLLESEPKRIIYLSCGLDTHARDIASLSEKYKPVFWKLYNFFPRTPHIEGLCVLEKK